MAERLFTGTVEHHVSIDERIVAALTNWRFDRVAEVDKAVLRLGAYELMREPQTPAAVVIDEAVELAKRFSGADSPAFVNGVLDALKQKVR
jgi:N utilization substance protein B